MFPLCCGVHLWGRCTVCAFAAHPLDREPPSFGQRGSVGAGVALLPMFSLPPPLFSQVETLMLRGPYKYLLRTENVPFPPSCVGSECYRLPLLARDADMGPSVGAHTAHSDCPAIEAVVLWPT